MDVIKSSRFWLALGVLISIAVFAALGKLGAETAAGYLMAILAGFGVGKAGSTSVKALLPFLLVASLLGASGCCSTPRCYVGRAITAFEGVDRLALPAIDVVCTQKIKACGSVPREQCSAYGQCTNALTAYRAAMDATGRTLATVNRLLSDLGVE